MSNTQSRRFQWWKHLVLPLLIILLSVKLSAFFTESIDRHIKTSLTLDQVNGGAQEFVASEGYASVAKGNLLVAEAEAKSVGLVTEALKQAASNPAVLELRRIEAFKEVGKAWKGDVPNFLVIGGGGGSNAVPPLFLDARK